MTLASKFRATGGGYGNGSYQIHPGTYDVVISRDGLESKAFTLELKSGYNTALTTFLKAENNDFNFYTLKDHYADFQKLAEIASQDNNLTTDQDTSAEEFISNFQQQYSLYQTALPIGYYTRQETTLEDGSPWYTTIDAFQIMTNRTSECQKLICLKVAISKISDNSLVEKQLIDKGFNPDYYEITY